MRNNADFINFNLEQKCTFLITKCWSWVRRGQRERSVYICNVCLLGTLYTFLFAISVYKVTL